MIYVIFIQCERERLLSHVSCFVFMFHVIFLERLDRVDTPGCKICFKRTHLYILN